MDCNKPEIIKQCLDFMGTKIYVRYSRESVITVSIFVVSIHLSFLVIVPLVLLLTRSRCVQWLIVLAAKCDYILKSH